MKRSLIAAAVLSLLGTNAMARATRDVAFTYRMGAGFPGDVNRTHPASILPAMNDATNPVRLYGDPVVVNTAANTVRGLIAADTAVTRLYGVAVRPYPVQQQSGGPNAALGVAAPPVGQGASPLDVLRDGYIIVRCNNFATQQPTKDGAVWVWIAASAGAQVQGGFSSVVGAPTTNTAAIANARFCGPTDANGYCELEILAT